MKERFLISCGSFSWVVNYDRFCTMSIKLTNEDARFQCSKLPPLTGCNITTHSNIKESGNWHTTKNNMINVRPKCGYHVDVHANVKFTLKIKRAEKSMNRQSIGIILQLQTEKVTVK